MCNLRFLSWNLRTFGAPIPPDSALRDIARLMLVSLADVIAIQEVQIGRDTTGQIGSDISPDVTELLQNLCGLLRDADPDAGWVFMVSGINNSDRARSMSDAYAFFWKCYPAASKFAHADPVQKISCLQSPVIIRRQGTDLLGRRPGMIVLDVTAKADVAPVAVNVVSWHAPTPCNQIAKNGAPSSGRGIIDLGSIPEVGGWVMVDRTGGHAVAKPEPGAPLPFVDTIVLGDFNYKMDAPKADIVYYNLLNTYQPCISTPDKIVTTTYSSDPTKPFKNPSSYDNIFALKPHGKFLPSLSFTGQSGALDFIRMEAEQLGRAAEIAYYPTETAWYVIFIDQYKRQYAKDGISDHLPVWADFKLGQGVPGGTSNARPTSGAGNNCAFHALGALDAASGMYVDPDAAQHRNDLANWILAAIDPGDLARLQAIQDDLVRTLIDAYSANPQAIAFLNLCLDATAQDLAQSADFKTLVEAYIAVLRNTRMLTWHELAMLAQQLGITIRLWNSDSGEYRFRDLNAGHAVTETYHFGVHFFRYIPN